MKRKTMYKKFSMVLVCLMAIFLIGCGNNNTADNNGANEPAASAEPSAAPSGDTQSGVVAGSETGQTNNNTTSGNTQNNADINGAGTAMTGTPQASEANPINDRIKGYYSETVPYPLLETEIIDELDYENLDMSSTRYYYNYVDLNDDGIDEILVQLNGEYNTTKNGDTLLIVEQERRDNDDLDDDGFDVIAQYTAFVNPVIVSDHKTNGYRDLIFMNPNGTYSKVVYGRDDYKNMSTAQTLTNIDDISGVALLCNDVAADTENNTGLLFSK